LVKLLTLKDPYERMNSSNFTIEVDECEFRPTISPSTSMKLSELKN
jgi:hypothetical protein